MVRRYFALYGFSWEMAFQSKIRNIRMNDDANIVLTKLEISRMEIFQNKKEPNRIVIFVGVSYNEPKSYRGIYTDVEAIMRLDFDENAHLSEIHLHNEDE